MINAMSAENANLLKGSMNVGASTISKVTFQLTHLSPQRTSRLYEKGIEIRIHLIVRDANQGYLSFAFN